MRKLDTMLKDYVSKITNDNLKFLSERLNNRLNGDLAEALNFMSNNQELDRWLGAAKTCDDFYDLVDTAQEYVFREYDRRIPDLVRG